MLRVPAGSASGQREERWHTRTKAKRAPELQGAAPDMWVELSENDARSLGASEGEVVQVASRRGSIEAPARISHAREGVVFAPWHYGSSTSTPTS